MTKAARSPAGARKSRKSKKRRHGPGWIAPKVMMAAIQAQLVPAAVAAGWTPSARRPGRKWTTRNGEFEFERSRPDRFERIGFDFRYGDRPDIWLSMGEWTGSDGACEQFRSADCYDYSRFATPLWRRALKALWKKLRREPRPEPLAEALAKGLHRFQVVEDYLRNGVVHPDLHLRNTTPCRQWPEGHVHRATDLEGKSGD